MPRLAITNFVLYICFRNDVLPLDYAQFWDDEDSRHLDEVSCISFVVTRKDSQQGISVPRWKSACNDVSMGHDDILNHQKYFGSIFHPYVFMSRSDLR